MLPAGSVIETAGAAKILDVSVDRVRQLRRAGQLQPVYVTPSGRALFARESVVELARERKPNRRGTRPRDPNASSSGEAA